MCYMSLHIPGMCVNPLSTLYAETNLQPFAMLGYNHPRAVVVASAYQESGRNVFSGLPAAYRLLNSGVCNAPNCSNAWSVQWCIYYCAL